MTYRTLIIDDEPSILQTLAHALHERGHETIAAASTGECPLLCDGECLCRDGEVCANFLVIDQNLPGVKGLDFVEHLDRKGCKIPPENRAIMSAFLDLDELARADRLRCKVLHKPVTFTKLNLWLDEFEPQGNSAHRLTALTQLAVEK